MMNIVFSGDPQCFLGHFFFFFFCAQLSLDMERASERRTHCDFTGRLWQPTHTPGYRGMQQIHTCMNTQERKYKH